MKQANELRIGNYVHFEKPVHVQLGDIIMPDIVRLGSYGIHLVDVDENTKVSGIPLAPEILKKCGFTNNWIRLSENIMLIIHPDEANIYDIKRDQTLQLLIPCSFLHQLQNLYRALTGTELNITL